MKLRVLKQTGRRLELEVEGEDHSLLNLLTKTMLKMNHVKFAAYRIDHPLVGKPVVIIETDGEIPPIEAMKRGLEEIKKLSREFMKKFETAIGSSSE
ncbi:MAG: DNA-directed RNA polymerase subunit L [Desulfurococcales archaeon ex4484_217_1]|nr:MAG: DNA-directed RNA polymerase subunit L [Desulfurococcales archaeon ex4484_217_1]